ncbi:uncharacterized protein DDB_G0287625-like [Ylistrum balloti]|uniref:uncharacterized protein DDB_G0287625-like n=1 Tax=Ylistrum balloti TaxID=509963 RepID=UPI002905CD35|nr:uncharacterized protein DDB_G0287625-like [Ylistrum balloti]XP_060068937.1 uncharacterized protein DDB_G0287625-like [Ylistrum balloti]
MTAGTHVVPVSTRCSVSNKTLVFVIRLCTLLVFHLLLSVMVTSAPSGSTVDYRFSYNTSDFYVDRVCRRVPVLLDPSVDPPCRIVDVDCIVEDPCVRPDPVDRLLGIAPCPPVWNPALVCSPDVGTKLQCTEKFMILLKCFRSPNKTVYDLSSRKESCKLQNACGVWLKTCPDEYSRLSDVFVSCSETEIGTTNTHYDDTTIITLSRSMPQVTDSIVDNTTNDTYHVVRKTPLLVDHEIDSSVIWNYFMIPAGILAPMLSMFIIVLICRKIQKRKRYQVSDRRNRDEHVSGSVTVITEVPSETSPFLYVRPSENPESTSYQDAMENIPFIDDAEIIPTCEIHLSHVYENWTNDIPDTRSVETDRSLPIENRDRSLLSHTDVVSEINFERPETFSVSRDGSVPESTGAPPERNPYRFDDKETQINPESSKLLSSGISNSNIEDNDIDKHEANTDSLEDNKDETPSFENGSANTKLETQEMAVDSRTGNVSESIEAPQENTPCLFDDKETSPNTDDDVDSCETTTDTTGIEDNRDETPSFENGSANTKLETQEMAVDSRTGNVSESIEAPQENTPCLFDDKETSPNTDNDVDSCEKTTDTTGIEDNRDETPSFENGSANTKLETQEMAVDSRTGNVSESIEAPQENTPCLFDDKETSPNTDDDVDSCETTTDTTGIEDNRDETPSFENGSANTKLETQEMAVDSRTGNVSESIEAPQENTPCLFDDKETSPNTDNDVDSCEKTTDTTGIEDNRDETPSFENGSANTKLETQEMAVDSRTGNVSESIEAPQEKETVPIHENHNNVSSEITNSNTDDHVDNTDNISEPITTLQDNTQKSVDHL